MERERISVIVRCHNQGRFLAEALGSLVLQTRPADEVIVMDDGSEDDTADVAKAYRGTLPLTLVQRRPARGAAAAFNDAVRRSTGDLLIPLDADDRLSDRYLELTADALAAGPYDIAYGGEHRFGAETTATDPRPFDRNALMVENMVHVSALFRRWVFDATGGFREEFDALGLEDWEFWIAAVECGASATAVDGCWLEYRRHNCGARSRFSRRSALAAHLRVRQLHSSAVRWRHLGRWMGRSLRRNLKRMLPA